MSLSPRLAGTRTGFTMIELLIVLAIVALLTGLLLPGVQKVRDVASRSTCQNNLKQIITAAHSYESSNRQFPPGLDTQMIGPFVSLLPHLEMEQQYRLFSIRSTPPTSSSTPSSVLGYYDDPQNRPPNGFVLPASRSVYGAEGTPKVFQCPAARKPEEASTVIIASAPNKGFAHTDYPWTSPFPTSLNSPTSPVALLASGSPGDKIIGRTNYAANAGYRRSGVNTAGYPIETFGGTPMDVNGPFRYNKNRGTRSDKVYDGLSHTIFFAEVNAGNVVGKIVSPSWAHGVYWPHLGVCGHGAGTSSIGTTWTSNCNNYRGVMPNSQHAGGAINVAIGDGSVRALDPKQITDSPMWAALHGISEGLQTSGDW